MKLIFSIILFTVVLNAKIIKIMPLGDSITYENHYRDVKNPRPAGERSAYRNYLWYKLTNAKYPIDFVGSRIAGQSITPSFDPDNEGYPGWTTYDIAEHVYDFLVQNEPDIILLHIGSNDWDTSIQGLNTILNEIDRYEVNYEHTIKVILARIINRRDYVSWITTYNINLQNLANTRISNGDNITVVDMEYGAGINYTYDMEDPAHPTPAGYKKMAEVWYKALQSILPTPKENPLLKAFVERFYNKILKRAGEETGVLHWVDALETQTLSATDLAKKFIQSQEFTSKNTDNETYLDVLYAAFFNRDADVQGYTYWLNELSNGRSRLSILDGFLHSQEFKLLSQSYEIRVDDTY